MTQTAALWIWAMLGCDMGEGGGPPMTVEDSTGVRVVRSVRPLWGPEEAWRLADSPSVVIGEYQPSQSTDGTDGSVTFRCIRALLALPDGRLVVANPSSPPELVREVVHLAPLPEAPTEEPRVTVAIPHGGWPRPAIWKVALEGSEGYHGCAV